MTLPTGGLVTILILLPNLLWMLLPPREQAGGTSEPEDGIWRVLGIIEWVGRLAAMIIPFFYRIEVHNIGQWLALAVAILALLFYYTGWARYFLRGKRQRLLFEPLLGLPIPLAISPIVCWGAASALFGSWPLATATAILALAHIPISLREWKRAR